MTAAPASARLAAGTGEQADTSVPMLPYVKPISKGLYLGSIISSYAVAVLLVVPGFFLTTTAGPYDEEQVIAGLGFTCGACLPLTFFVVMLMVLLAKLWAAIPREYARTSPGMAVGLLFIPLFQFYWIFQVFWGWSVDYNRMTRSRGLSLPRVSEGLAMTVCILAAVAAIPFVGLPLGVINWILVPVFLSKAIDGVNRLAAVSAGTGVHTQRSELAGPA